MHLYNLKNGKISCYQITKLVLFQNIDQYYSNTGIKLGELISFHWKDIDYDKKRIAIDITTVNGK